MKWPYRRPKLTDTRANPASAQVPWERFVADTQAQYRRQLELGFRAGWRAISTYQSPGSTSKEALQNAEPPTASMCVGWTPRCPLKGLAWARGSSFSLYSQTAQVRVATTRSSCMTPFPRPYSGDGPTHSGDRLLMYLSSTRSSLFTVARDLLQLQS